VNKFLTRIFVFLGLITALSTFIWLPTHAADVPAAVELAEFNLIPLENAVRIEWRTGSESGTLGFRIKRAASGENETYLDYVGENGFIAATGSITLGADYAVIDDQVQNGEEYTYVLMEVEQSSTEKELERGTVSVGIPPTNTPIVASGGSSGGSTAATATPTRKATTQATRTPTTSGTKTTQSTATPSTRDFVTVTPNVSQQVNSSPESNASAEQSNTNNNTGNNTFASLDNETTSTNSNVTGASEVFAQENDTSANSETMEVAAQSDPASQEDYPGATPTETAVSDQSDSYPGETNENSVGISAPSRTPVPVIGSDQGYMGNQNNDANQPKSSSNNQGRVYLWLGFIVALLIFATGLIGSILLFIRKSK
jgi:hypothetical protein